MSITFREARPSEIDDAVEQLGDEADTLSQGDICRQLCVIANDPKKALGTAVVTRNAADHHRIHIELRKGSKPDLARDLVGRALGKAAAQGMSILAVTLPDVGKGPTVWESADWLSRLEEAA
jgi:hypothetical protein